MEIWIPGASDFAVFPNVTLTEGLLIFKYLNICLLFPSKAKHRTVKFLFSWEHCVSPLPICNESQRQVLRKWDFLSLAPNTVLVEVEQQKNKKQKNSLLYLCLLLNLSKAHSYLLLNLSGVINLILQIRKLRPRGINWLSQGYKASTCWSQDPHLRFLTPVLLLLAYHLFGAILYSQHCTKLASLIRILHWKVVFRKCSMEQHLWGSKDSRD